jgi:alkanesulfonate monooxygenase
MTLRFYATVPRVGNLSKFTQTALDMVRWSDQYDFDGVLLFAGTGAVLDPWILATATIAASSRLIPMIAVNPVYVHPAAAARMVASIGHIYGRAVSLNLITGTALSDLAAIGDSLDHDDRYARLLEYATIVRALLSSPRPLTYEGRFYTIARAQLTPSLPASLLPDLFIAGHSSAAAAVAGEISAIRIGMLSQAPTTPPSASEAQHFGVITRPTAAQAWEAARRSFPPDQLGVQVAEASMANTDSVWKRLLMASETADDPIYWTLPFRSGRADCPYVVASHQELADLFARLVAAGTTNFVLDIPSLEADFRHASDVINLVRRAKAP